MWTPWSSGGTRAGWEGAHRLAGICVHMMERAKAVLVTAVLALGLILATSVGPSVRALQVEPDRLTVCGGVLGLRDWASWQNGWKRHLSACIKDQRCVRGTLEIELDRRPESTGSISADTDEHLLAQGIHAGVSLGWSVARVSFYRQELTRTSRGYRLVTRTGRCPATTACSGTPAATCGWSGSCQTQPLDND